MSLKKDALHREIIKINPKVPSPDIIQNYKDVTKTKGYLRYYNFHPLVFESLFNIAYQKFFSEERYDKKYLFDIVRIHYKKRPKSYVHSQELFDNIILLFKGTMLSDNPAAKMCARSLVRNIPLPEEFLEWLMKHFSVSEEIATTLLRYPFEHPLIYKWVNQNFEDENLRSRRSELIALKLNQDPAFKVSANTIIADLEYYIQDEINGYKSFINDSLLYFRELESEVGSRPSDYEEFERKMNVYVSSYGVLPLLSRETYDRSTIMQQIGEIEAFLNLYEIAPFFKQYHYRYKHYRIFESYSTAYLPIEEIYSKVLFYHPHELAKQMIYGIYYSNFSKKTKEKLIKEYVTEKTIPLIERIAIKLKSITLLKWLMKGEFILFPTMRFKKKK